MTMMTAERTDGRTGGRGWACSGRNELQGGGGGRSHPTLLDSNWTRVQLDSTSDKICKDQTTNSHPWVHNHFDTGYSSLAPSATCPRGWGLDLRLDSCMPHSATHVHRHWLCPLPIAQCPVSPLPLPLRVPGNWKVQRKLRSAEAVAATCNVQRATCSRQHHEATPGLLMDASVEWLTIDLCLCELSGLACTLGYQNQSVSSVGSVRSVWASLGQSGQCQQDLPQSDTLVRPCKMPFDCDLKTLTWWPFKFHGQHEQPKIQVNFPCSSWEGGLSSITALDLMQMLCITYRKQAQKF